MKSRANPDRFFEWVFRKPLTPRRAGRAIAAAAFTVTVVSGVAMRLIDHRDFGSIGLGLWWAVQTVTTVGYGDVVPKNDAGRIVASLVMLSGIGLLTVVTASITAALVENARRRLSDQQPTVQSKLDQIDARLERLEALLRAKSG